MDDLKKLPSDVQKRVFSSVAKSLANIQDLDFEDVKASDSPHGVPMIELNHPNTWKGWSFKHLRTILTAYWVSMMVLIAVPIACTLVLFFVQPNFFIPLFGLSMDDTKNAVCRARFDAAGIAHDRGICPNYFLGMEIRPDLFIFIMSIISLGILVFANSDRFSKGMNNSESLHMSNSNELSEESGAAWLMADAATPMAEKMSMWDGFRALLGFHSNSNWIVAHGVSPMSSLVEAPLFMTFFALAVPYTGDHGQAAYWSAILIAFLYQSIGCLGSKLSSMAPTSQPMVGFMLVQFVTLVGSIMLYYFGGFDYATDHLTHDVSRVRWAFWGFAAIFVVDYFARWTPLVIRALRGPFDRSAIRGQVYVVHDTNKSRPEDRLSPYEGDDFSYETLQRNNVHLFRTDLPHSDFLFSLVWALGSSLVMVSLFVIYLLSIRFSLTDYLFV